MHVISFVMRHLDSYPVGEHVSPHTVMWRVALAADFGPANWRMPGGSGRYTPDDAQTIVAAARARLRRVRDRRDADGARVNPVRVGAVRLTRVGHLMRYRAYLEATGQGPDARRHTLRRTGDALTPAAARQLLDWEPPVGMFRLTDEPLSPELIEAMRGTFEGLVRDNAAAPA